MSTKTHLMLAASVAAFFVVACADGDLNSPESAKSVTVQTDPKAPTTDDYEGLKNDNTLAEPEELRSEKELESFRKADSIGKILPSIAAGLNALDSTHMFIRTADVRCRVDKVSDATYRVEDVVKDLGGYVSDTKLASNQTWQNQTQVSNDSIRQVTRFVVTNTITIRVPAKNLDSLLRALVPLVQYMDYRNVNVNDITLDQLAQQLEQKRLATYNAMLKDKVIEGNTKSKTIIEAADAMLAKQAQSDAAFIESLRLKDQVAYATLSLQLYQPESSHIAMIFHEKPAEPYQIGIGERITDAAYAGWRGFSYFISGVILFWPLWLIGGIVYYLVRRQLKKAAKAA